MSALKILHSLLYEFMSCFFVVFSKWDSMSTNSRHSVSRIEKNTSQLDITQSFSDDDMKSVIDKTMIEALRDLLFWQSVNTKSMSSNSIWNAVRSELHCVEKEGC